MAIGDRIVAFREAKNINQTELAQKTGINRSVLNRIELNTRPVRSDELAAIAKVLNITMDKLAGLSPHLPAGVYNFNESNYIPVIGAVRCGVGGLAYEYIDEYITVDDKYRPEEIVAFRAVGDSMEGEEIHDGNICIVHLQEDVEDGAIAVVVINGEEGTLKRVRKQTGMIILEAANPAYPPRVFAGEDANNVKIVGRVIEVRQKK